MLGQGFEPWSSARKANMIGRTTPTERTSKDVTAIDKSVSFGRRGHESVTNSKRAPPVSLFVTLRGQS